MSIDKNNNETDSGVGMDFSPVICESLSTDEDSVEDQESNEDGDSGAGSDRFDLLELGEPGTEFCRVGDEMCSLPFDLYELEGLEGILSVEVWNDVLSEEERFGLARYLPDMDRETFTVTLREVLAGCNVHFGSPISKLFNLLKGGMCEPRVAIYREGVCSFQRRQHYHLLRRHHNVMVKNLCQLRDAWANYKGYSIEEKLRVLSIRKCQRSLMDDDEDVGDAFSAEDELDEALWTKRAKGRKNFPKGGTNSMHKAAAVTASDYPQESPYLVTDPLYEKQNLKQIMKSGRSNMPSMKQLRSSILAGRAFDRRSASHGMMACPKQSEGTGVDRVVAPTMRQQMKGLNEADEPIYGGGILGMDPSISRNSSMGRAMCPKVEKKRGHFHNDEYENDYFAGLPVSSRGDLHIYARRGLSNEPSASRISSSLQPGVNLCSDHARKRAHSRNIQGFMEEDQMVRASSRSRQLQLKENRAEVMRGKACTSNHDVAESDSSEVSDDKNSNPLMGRKLAFPGVFREVSAYALSRPKKNSMKIGAKESARASEGIVRAYKDEFDPDLRLQVSPKEKEFSSIRKKKGKMRHKPNGQGLAKDVNGDRFHGSADDDMSQLYQNNGFLGQEPGDSPQMSPMKAYPDDVKLRPSHGGFVSDEEEELVEERHPAANDEVNIHKRKRKNIDPHDRLDGVEYTFLGNSSVSKKRKVKENIAIGDDIIGDGYELKQVEEFNTTTKKKRKKLDPDQAASGKDIPEIAAVAIPVADVEMEPEIKPKRKTFTLITPTVHTGFSFSIIHLLSAVRMVMITQLPEDLLNVGKSAEDETKKCDATCRAVASQVDADADATDSVQAATANVPSLSIQEIVNRVRSNPGDPCILETQEPLQDLVRGVLKIFQSKSAPLGAKGWKSLVFFEKSTKCWSWMGPVSCIPSDLDPVEEVTTPEAWRLPHKMMVKLVDAFANWLKNSQETLQQLGSLPPLPSALTAVNLDEKERFRDLRVQKSLGTISPSSVEIRDYFRLEESLRYSIPDRAFSYTAADGKKSIVAPLRRCGGKPTSKARDHFMLKKDRPPHVTILCLVRDAAARLPGSIGTRADICTLIRDSQFVVEDVSDAQVNQVVSGALDRLHYERDPCVQFDSERKLWKYLHREREEEDFEDDGTSSTKKWRRPKKDGAEQSDQGAATLADQQGSEEWTGLELCSNLNMESLCPDNDMAGILLEDDIRPVIEGVAINGSTDHGNANHDDQSVLLGSLNYDPTQENIFPCQENSANNDFNDETFGPDQVELLDPGLL